MQDIVRFITCGSVDDGKSTLIGRLLYDSNMILKDQLDALKKDSKKFGTTESKIDFALLLDGLQSEREQGITIDVAYRYFYINQTKFIIADTPGHEQYTKNMATGASNADLALVLIDATKGVLAQTKMHSYIISLFGIKNIIVAINKMDLVNFSYDVFKEIKKEYQNIIKELDNSDELNVSYIPVSALNGDNIIDKSSKTPWYKDKALIKLLQVPNKVYKLESKDDFRFFVQYVNRPNQNFRGYAGTISKGSIKVGDDIMILPSEKISKIKSLILPATNELLYAKSAYFPMVVTITLEDDIDIGRGDMLVHTNNTLTLSDKLEAMVVWMSDKPMKSGNSYIIKRATTVINASFAPVEYKRDINTLKKIITDTLKLNDIARCTLKLDRKIPFDIYKSDKTSGSFIIIDKFTNSTLGAGIIISSLKSKKTENYHTLAEKELNAFIRRNYPDWECRNILQT
jgi:sulfate adenylyltransferase subunit 1